MRCVVVECSQRIYNLFETHSRNVRNVFILCMLHIRKTKVWFLACKNPLFGVQKVGFYIAKVWFLFFKRVFFVLQYTIPYPRNSTKWHCVFPSLILQYIIPYPRNTHQMALRYIVPRPRTPTKWHCVGAIWQYNIYLFLGIAHLFISY